MSVKKKIGIGIGILGAGFLVAGTISLMKLTDELTEENERLQGVIDGEIDMTNNSINRLNSISDMLENPLKQKRNIYKHKDANILNFTDMVSSVK